MHFSFDTLCRLFFTDLLRLFFINRFDGLYYIIGIIFRPFHPDLTLDQAVFRTAGNTVILSGIDRKPAQLLSGITITIDTPCTGDLPVMHRILFGRKFP